MSRSVEAVGRTEVILTSRSRASTAQGASASCTLHRLGPGNVEHLWSYLVDRGRTVGHTRRHS